MECVLSFYWRNPSAGGGGGIWLDSLSSPKSASRLTCAGTDGRAEGAGSAEPACPQTKAVLERPSRKWPHRALLRDRVRAARKRFVTA